MEQEAQLTAACNAQELSASAAAETLFTQYSNESDTHLGVFGNADYAKLADWMEILPKAAVPAGVRPCPLTSLPSHLNRRTGRGVSPTYTTRSTTPRPG